MWPRDAEELTAHQRRLAAVTPAPWQPPVTDLRVGGCWVCSPRGHLGPGRAGDPAWTAAVLQCGDRLVDRQVTTGVTDAPYVPGLLALRIGRLLDEVVRTLSRAPDVLLVDATGRDHPRRAGLALQLGAELDLPTVGVTHRPLRAEGEWPPDVRGAVGPVRIGGEVVACWVRTRAGARPLVVHPGWRIDLETAVDVVLGSSRRRTPEPLRLARQAARSARSHDEQTHPPSDEQGG
jgi:deoxyribonuclease V